MAKKQTVIFEDDLDGTVSDDVTPVIFAIDGKTMSIDLKVENATELRNLLEPYVAKARVIGKTKVPTVRKPKSEVNTVAVREWAKVQGLDVKDRGRLNKEIVDAYRADQANTHVLVNV